MSSPAPPEDSPLTPRQQQIVEQTWQRLAEDTDRLAEVFYRGLFDRSPDVKPLFDGSDMAEQGKKLVDLLNVAVKGLAHFPFLVPSIQELGKRHVSYGVKTSHYAAVRAALLGAIADGLAGEYDEETRDAWEVTYDTLAKIMKEAAEGESG